MKALVSKRYAIKVGTAFLSYETLRKLEPTADKPKGDVERLVVTRTWTNQRSAQAVADHLRGEFLPELGAVIVTEFPTVIIR